MRVPVRRRPELTRVPGGAAPRRTACTIPCPAFSCVCCDVYQSHKLHKELPVERRIGGSEEPSAVQPLLDISERLLNHVFPPVDSERRAGRPRPVADQGKKNVSPACLTHGLLVHLDRQPAPWRLRYGEEARVG